MSDSTKCEEERPFSKHPHIENDKRGEMSDSTRCEEECSLPKSPHNQSDKRGEVSESTKCEDQIVRNEIREMEYLHHAYPTFSERV